MSKKTKTKTKNRHYLAHLGARDTAALFTNAGVRGG